MIICTAPEKDFLEIKGVRFHGEIYQKITGCPDKKRFKNGRFIIQNCTANIKYLIETFPEAKWECDDKYQFLAQEKQESEMLANKEKTFEFKQYPEVFKTQPFAHQFQAFELSKDAEAYGLFFEQGCGKTKVTIDNAVYLFLQNKIKRLVIIAPNGVHTNWITTELPAHCNIEYDSFCWKGVFTKKIQQNLEAVAESSKLQIFTFNIEAFVSNKTQAILLNLLKEDSMLVIDESQGIKNPQALRTKFFVKTKAKFKRILSGTPVTKGVEDIFSQFLFLNPKILGITSFFAFKSIFCIQKKFQNPSDPFNERKAYSKIVGYQQIDLLQDKIQTYTTRVLKKDCLDLPEKIYQREFVTLTAEQKRIDNEIREEGITYLQQCKNSGEPVTIASALARLTKRQQVSCGYLLNTDEEAVLEIVAPEKNPRLLKLKSLLDVIEGKVIIWCRFTQDVDYIMKILGNKAVRYDGKVSTEEKEINKVKFQQNADILYFVAKPIKGLTLTAGTTNIYYSNDFDLEKRQQSEDRSHRFGTKEALEKAGLKNVLYIDLEALGTIDGKIITALRAKKKIADMVLQDPESMFMESNV